VAMNAHICGAYMEGKLENHNEDNQQTVPTVRISARTAKQKN
jgi:hypothetical protein